MVDTLTFRDRARIEDFRKVGEDVVLGAVSLDPDACTGCGLCARACPAGSLELVDGKARMSAELPMCMSCCDCVAICPAGAIEIARFIEFRHAFRYLDRGVPEGPRRF